MNLRRLFISSLSILLFFSVSSCGGGTETESDDFLKEVQASYDLAETWLLKNFQEEGYFLYAYDPRNDSISKDNNMIRQFMSSRLLGELSKEDESLIPMHRKNLEYIFEHWYQETEDGKYGYILYSKKSKLGANAMALRMLVASPYFEEYGEQAKKLADGILSLMEEDGELHPWFREPSGSYDSAYLLTFYSGEAILSLVEYGTKTSDDLYLNAAVKAQDYYLRLYVDELEENYYPAYVPWHTLSMNLLYKLTGDEKYADAIFILNDKLLELQDKDDHIGRFYNPDTPQYGNPHSSSDGVYTEGLAYALEVAKMKDDKEHIQRYETAIRLSFQNLKSLQFTSDNIPEGYDRDKLIGAFSVREGDPRIRVDTTQHIMDAYMKILAIMSER